MRIHTKMRSNLSVKTSMGVWLGEDGKPAETVITDFGYFNVAGRQKK